MRRATITIPDDLAKAVDKYIAEQEATPTLTAVVQAALRRYLEQRGVLQKPRPFRITPAKKGSGVHDLSINHDKYFAEP
jgi:metal-responsive CopG/Arc/MetJ family transcriptional regulator